MPTSANLVFGKVLRVSDLPHSEKLKFLTDANQPVAHVTTVKEEVVATPEAVAPKLLRLRPSPKSSRRASRRPREKVRAAPEKAEKAEKKEKK